MTRPVGYRTCRFARKPIEAVFGDNKQRGVIRQLKLRGPSKAWQIFSLATTVVTLRRLPTIVAVYQNA